MEDAPLTAVIASCSFFPYGPLSLVTPVSQMEPPTDADLSHSKRWHLSRSGVAGINPGITVGIASEYSWCRGYARWGIHIEAKNNKVEEGYSRWSVGLAVDAPGGSNGVPRRRFIDRDADTSFSFNTLGRHLLHGVSLGLLRDVREPVERIFYPGDLEDHWVRVSTWRRMLLHRAAVFYGTGSTQYRALYEYAGNGRALPAAAMGITPLDVLPRWRHIKSMMAMADEPYEEQVIWRSVLHQDEP